MVESFALVETNGFVDLTSTVEFAPAGESAIDSVIGHVVDDVQAHGGSVLFQSIAEKLVDEPTLAALDLADHTIAATGVSAVPKAQIDAVETSLSLVTDRMDDWRRGADHHNNGLWIAFSGAGQSGSGYSGRAYGGAAGFEQQIPGRSVLLGAALSVFQTNFGLAAPYSSGNTATAGLTVYGAGGSGPAYVSGMGYLGLGHARFRRNLYDLGLDLATTARFNSTMFAGRLEAGYRFVAPSGLRVTSFAAIEPVATALGDAKETFNGGAAGLIYRGTTVTAVPAELGVQLGGTLRLAGGGALNPFVRAAWSHDFRPDRNVTRAFAEMPGDTFDVSSMPTVADAAKVRAGLRLQFSKTLSFDAAFDGTVSRAYGSYGGQGGFRLVW